MREYGHQCVVWQTAVNPVVALELLATGAWSGAGVLGPEAFDAVPFLDLLTEYGSPWGQRRTSPDGLTPTTPGRPVEPTGWRAASGPAPRETARPELPVARSAVPVRRGVGWARRPDSQRCPQPVAAEV